MADLAVKTNDSGQTTITQPDQADQTNTAVSLKETPVCTYNQGFDSNDGTVYHGIGGCTDTSMIEDGGSARIASDVAAYHYIQNLTHCSGQTCVEQTDGGKSIDAESRIDSVSGDLVPTGDRITADGSGHTRESAIFDALDRVGFQAGSPVGTRATIRATETSATYLANGNVERTATTVVDEISAYSVDVYLTGIAVDNVTQRDDGRYEAQVSAAPAMPETTIAALTSDRNKEV